MNTITICLNDTVALCDSTVIELAKLVNSGQPCIQEAQTNCYDVIIVGTICGTIALICAFLFTIALWGLWKKHKIRENVALFDIDERKTKLSLDVEERKRKFDHEDEDRKRKFVQEDEDRNRIFDHEDEDRAWKNNTEEENKKRMFSEEDKNSQHIASIRERQIKALDKVIEKIDDIKDTDYQIWKELAKTIAELTKSINSK